MNIQTLRSDKGWSQEELAMHSGLSVRTIQRIENGQRASLESLKCLAAVFETNVSDLVQERPMSTPSSNDKPFIEHAEKEAIAYVKKLKEFHIHWISFVIVIPCLAVLNINTSPEKLWVVYVALGWGLGLVLYAAILFGQFSMFGGDWEQKQFRKYMDRIGRHVD